MFSAVSHHIALVFGCLLAVDGLPTLDCLFAVRRLLAVRCLLVNDSKVVILAHRVVFDF